MPGHAGIVPSRTKRRLADLLHAHLERRMDDVSPSQRRSKAQRCKVHTVWLIRSAPPPFQAFQLAPLRRSTTGGDVSAHQVRLGEVLQACLSLNLRIRSLGVFRLGTSEHEHEHEYQHEHEQAARCR